MHYSKQQQHYILFITYIILDTAFNPSSPPQFTKDIPSTVSQVRFRPTSKSLRHCLENHTGGYFLRSRVIYDDEG